MERRRAEREVVEAARNRVVTDELSALVERIDQLERELSLTKRRLETVDSANRLLRKSLARHEAAAAKRAKTLDSQLAALRLDRQLLALPRWGARKVMPGRRTPRHVAIICPAYPGGPTSYGGEFVRARVRLYRERGWEVTVIVPARAAAERTRYLHEGTPVIRTSLDDLLGVLDETSFDLLAVHHLLPATWEVIRSLRYEIPIAVWVHGYEARSWRELEFNYTSTEIAEKRKTFDALDVAKRETMAEIFPDERIDKVFVSAFMRGIAERFAGVSATRAQVIPNVIDERTFAYQRKAAEDRRRILWVRSFAKRNYANDLARDAILQLSRRPNFRDLRVTIAGDGELFDECTGPLRELSNVTVERGFVSTERMVEFHRTHGVMLVPTRWDSQGLTCGEAMSSGLVPVTNAVAAIPEFVPEEAGMLCPPEDAGALADAITALQADPQLFLSKSSTASHAVREKCGIARTVDRELALLKART